MPASPEPEEPRAGVTAADRERVIQALTQHYAHDRLSEPELEARLDRTLAAKNAVELAAVLGDLPVAAAPPGAALVAESAQVRAWLSGQERTVQGFVPRELVVSARAGYVELDLCRSSFAPGVTEIRVSVFAGYVKILFPPSVRVQVEGSALFGFFSAVPHGPSSSVERVVRVSGRATFGFVECIVAAGAFRPRLGPEHDYALPAAPLSER